MNRFQALIERIADGFDRLVPLRRLRPLERIPSIKLKLSVLIIAGIAITVATTTVGFWLNVRPRWSLLHGRPPRHLDRPRHASAL